MQGGFLGWIAVIGAAVAGVGIVWRKAIEPVVRGVGETADEVRELRSLLKPDDNGHTIPQRLTHLEQIVGEVAERSKQLEPNGGDSLYDRVGLLEQGQLRAARNHAEFTKKVAPMIETVAALAGPPRRSAPLKPKSPKETP